jgi:hypothetical protein
MGIEDSSCGMAEQQLPLPISTNNKELPNQLVQDLTVLLRSEPW